MNRLRWTCVALLLACLPLVEPAQAARRAPLYEPGQTQIVMLDGGTPGQEQVRSFILLGARQAGWAVTQEVGAAMLLRFDKGHKHNATIRVNYDDQTYTITYVDSYNLNHRVDDGSMAIHPAYNKWIHQLIRGIANAALRP